MTNQVWSTDRFPQSPPKQDPNSCTGKSKRRRISTPHCGNIIQGELQILQNQNFLGKRQRWQTSKDAKKCRWRWNFSAKLESQAHVLMQTSTGAVIQRLWRRRRTKCWRVRRALGRASRSLSCLLGFRVFATKDTTFSFQKSSGHPRYQSQFKRS